MNPIEKALDNADKIIAANAELERATREAPHSLLQQQSARLQVERLQAEADSFVTPEPTDAELGLADESDLPDEKRVPAWEESLADADEVTTLVVSFNVTGWSKEQIDALTGQVWAQGEATEDHPDVDDLSDNVYTHGADITVHDALQVGLGL